MPFTATFSNPEYNYTGGGSGTSEPVGAVDWAIDHSFDTVSAMVLTIRTDIRSKYDLETASANSIQLNSTMLFARGSATWFNGYVENKPTFFAGPLGNFLQVTCYGWDGILAKAFCVDSAGDAVWSIITSSVQVTQLPLQASNNYGSFTGSTLWPDPDDATGAKCYISDALSNSDALDVDIGTGTYAISAVSPGLGGWFETLDNVPDEFVADDTFEISGSTNNNDTWTVAGASWTGAATRITVDETVGAVADGGMKQPNIILSTSSAGFKPRGWVKIESEWIYFSGYDNSAADTKYRLRNVKRGELAAGAGAQAHVATTAVYEKVGKRIAPNTVFLEHDPGTGYVSLRRDQQYYVHEALGCYILSDPATGTYRVTAYYYDEDKSLNAGSIVYSVNDVIEALCTGSSTYRGPGFETFSITGVNQGAKTFTIAEDGSSAFAPGDILAVYNSTGNDGTYTITNVAGAGPTVITVSEAIPVATVDGKISPDLHFHSSTNLIKITRYDYDPKDKPVYVIDAIHEFIQSLELEDEVKFWFKHSTGKFRLRIIANDTKVYSIPWVTADDKSLSLEDIYSAVRVPFTDDVNLNQANSTYCWHQASAGAGASPDYYREVTSQGNGWDFVVGTFNDDVNAGTFGMQYTVDGKNTTKLAGMFTHNPAASFEFGHWWFGSGTTPPKIALDKIRISVNAYRVIDAAWQPYRNADLEYVVRIEGCDDYNTGTNTGTWVDQGFTMRGQPSLNGSAVDAEALTFVKRDVNCIRVIFDYMCGWQKINSHYGIVHYIHIEGNNVKYATCELTDSVSDIGDPTKLYAPLTYRKLRGGVKALSGVGGCPRAYHHQNIGATSDAAAISLARTLLITKLRQHSMRSVEYKGVLPGVPEIGITTGIDEDGDGSDDYTGVVRQITVARGQDGVIVTTGSVKSTIENVIT